MDLGKLGYGSANPWPQAANELVYRHLLDKAQAVDDLLAAFGRHLTERGVDPELVEAAMSLTTSQRAALTDDLCSLAIQLRSVVINQSHGDPQP